MFVVLVSTLLGLGCTSEESGSDSASDITITASERTEGGVDEAGEGGAVGDGSESAAPCMQGPLAGSDRGSVAFFAQCVDSVDVALYPVFRSRERDPSSAVERLEQRAQALVSGTTAEEETSGLSVGFDQIEEAGDIDVTADVSGDGVAMVEFTVDGSPWNPGASASASAQLISFLDPFLATVFADPELTAVDLDGLCWGELGCDAGLVDRATWEAQLFSNYGVLSHGSCDIAQSWVRPEACTVAGLTAGPLSEGSVVDVADDDTLNLRSGPGTGYSVVAEVAPDSSLDVTEAVAEAEDGGTWRLVQDVDGTVGWANVTFLAL